MNGTNVELTTTGGAQNCYFPYPYQPYDTGGVSTIGYWYVTPSEPLTCIGKAHVFECEHVNKCKCGAITRVMKKAKSRD